LTPIWRKVDISKLLENKMRPALLACAALVLGIGSACAERLGDPPDPNTFPLFHGRAKWTLGCANAHTLMWIKSELNGAPIRVETHARMAELRCTIIGSDDPLRLWHEYTYVGVSGVVNGPKFGQIVHQRMNGLILFVMRDEIHPN
jgi:hypothetical protein